MDDISRGAALAEGNDWAEGRVVGDPDQQLACTPDLTLHEKPRFRPRPAEARLARFQRPDRHLHLAFVVQV